MSILAAADASRPRSREGGRPRSEKEAEDGPDAAEEKLALSLPGGRAADSSTDEDVLPCCQLPVLPVPPCCQPLVPPSRLFLAPPLGPASESVARAQSSMEMSWGLSRGCSWEARARSGGSQEAEGGAEGAGGRAPALAAAQITVEISRGPSLGNGKRRRRRGSLELGAGKHAESKAGIGKGTTTGSANQQGHQEYGCAARRILIHSGANGLLIPRGYIPSARTHPPTCTVAAAHSASSTSVRNSPRGSEGPPDGPAAAEEPHADGPAAAEGAILARPDSSAVMWMQFSCPPYW